MGSSSGLPKGSRTARWGFGPLRPRARSTPSRHTSSPAPECFTTSRAHTSFDKPCRATSAKRCPDAALRQEAVRDAPAVVVLAGVYERTAKKYGARAERYVHMEAGHAAQNLLLQAVSLGLAAVPIGAFDDDEVQRSLNLPKNHRPLYLLPIGHRAR